MTTTDKLSLKQVKSRLFPLSPVESILEYLIECLPRHLIPVEIKPNDNVTVINPGQGEYNATVSPPYFQMQFGTSFPPSGWYYLEAALVRNNGNREACIGVETSGESGSRITIPIPSNLRGTVREVIYLPPNVTALHWSPSAAAGFFSQSKLMVHKISFIESALRRSYRVINDLWHYRHVTPAARFGLTWWGMLRNLHESYQRTAILHINRLTGTDYTTFIARNDTLKETDIRSMRAQLPQLQRRPVISLIMPIQDPIWEFSKTAIDSVCEQIYPDWELLLAGDFSPGNQIYALANEYQSKNIRVKIIPVAPNQDLATSFNTALKVAQGEFVARIDQHDQIPPNALYFLAREINQHPNADLIYTDEDSIDRSNRRIDPCFKPDWNPDLFFSHNYLAGLTLYRQARALMLDGYRPGFEGAEDYDFNLRYLRGLPANKIRHIPRVLYHQRKLSQTEPVATLSNDTGRQSHSSGKNALSDYFENSGTSVLDGPAPNFYRIKYPLPPHPPLVSIIIPTRDRVEILKKCINSIRQKTDYDNWEMLIIDNQSTDAATLDYLAEIQKYPKTRVLRYNDPFNYSAINNLAVTQATGEVLALLNNDVEVITPDWLTEMVSHALRPGIGAVGAKLLYANGTVQHAGVIIGIGGVAGHAHKHIKDEDHGYCHRAVLVQNLSAVTGAALVVKKSIYEEVGGLNERDLVVALNDIDFCLKIRAAGYQNVYTPYARLYHLESISRGHIDTPEKRALFAREFEYMKHRWGNALKSDPAYNPNLTLEFENFALTR